MERRDIHIELPNQGIVMGHVHPDTHDAYLARLKVTGPRHMGIGTKLLELFQAVASDMGALKITTYLATDPGEDASQTEKFITSNGFKRVDGDVALYRKTL